VAQVEIDLLLEATQALQSIKNFSAEANKQLSSINTRTLIGAYNDVKSAINDVAAAFSAPIKAALEAEDSFNRLESSLIAAKNTAPGVAEGLVQFAEGLAQVTRFSDDAIISATGLLQNLAPLTQQGLKEGTQAAIDLAAAFKIDLDTAIRAVGKAANGEVAALTRLGLEIKKGKTDAETYGNALEALSRIQGAGVRDGKTFSASLTQIGGAFENLLEEIGLVVIKNPQVIAAFQDIKNAIIALTAEVKAAGPILSELVSFIGSGISLAVKAVSEFISVFRIGFNEIERIVFASISFVLEQLSKLTSVFSGLPKVGDFFADINAQLQRLAVVTGSAATASEDANKRIIGAASTAVKGIRAVAAEVSSPNAAGDRFLAGARNNVKDVSAELEKLKKDLRGLDAIGAAKEIRKERLAIVDAAAAQEKISIVEAAKLRADIEKDFQKSRIKAEKELVEIQRKAAQEQIDDANALLSQLRGERRQGGQRGDTARVSQGTGLAVTLAEGANQLLKGAEGAASVLKGQAASLAVGALTAVIGPAAQVVGPLVSEIVGALAQGPAKVREMVTSFISSIPTMIENILLSIPVLIETLAEQLPLAIERLIENAPRIITEGILPRIPDIIVKLVEGMVRASAELSFRMPLVAAQLGISLAAEAPMIAVKTIDAFVKEAPRFITELIKSIPSAIGGVGGSIGGIGGGLLGGVTDVFGGIGSVFGFADGGGVNIPPGDTLFAGFNASETVINKQQTERFNRLLDQIESGRLGQGGARNVNVTLQVGQRELANVLLDLSQAGFRTV